MKVWAIDLTHHDDESRGFKKPRGLVMRSDYKKAIEHLVYRLKKKGYSYRILYTISMQSIGHGNISPTHCHMLVQCDDDSIVDAILDYWTKEKQYGGLANEFDQKKFVRAGQSVRECYDIGKWWYIRFQSRLGLHFLQSGFTRISKEEFRNLLEEYYPMTEEKKAEFRGKFERWQRNSRKTNRQMDKILSYENTMNVLVQMLEDLEESVTDLRKQGKDLTEWESCLSLINTKVKAVLDGKEI